MKNGSTLVSRTLRLREGRPLWQDSPRRAVRTRKSRARQEADVVIVGAGISGAIAALVIAESGREVTVVDRRQPAEGSTLASTAMIQFELDTPLTHLSRSLGKPAAEAAYLRSLRAVADLKDLLARNDIEAGWADRHALYLAGTELGSRAMKEEARVRREASLPSQYLDRSALMQQFGIDRTAAILSEGSAELDPVRTAAGCLRAAQRLGARVVSPFDVARVESSSAGVILHSASGETLSCRNTILATGYEFVAAMPHDGVEIVSTWAIATKPIPADRFWPGRCLIWEASDPYLYIRATADLRVIVGGEDSGLTSPARRARATPAKSQRLLGKARKLLSLEDLEIDYAWSGAFAESSTGLPVLQPVPEFPGVFVILGCGGNGITFSMIGAQLADAWLAGRPDRDAPLFRRRAAD